MKMRSVLVGLTLIGSISVASAQDQTYYDDEGAELIPQASNLFPPQADLEEEVPAPAPAKPVRPSKPGKPGKPGRPAPVPVPGPVVTGPVGPMPMPVPQYDHGISVWCNDRLVILQRAKRNASMATMSGNYGAAIDILIHGLQDASQNGYTMNPPMTQKIIRRGVKLAQVITSRLANNVKGLKASAFFLESYYKFIENVAHKFDIPYYVPGQCGYCNYESVMELESGLIDLVREEVKLATKLLIPGTIIPIGPSDLYLKAAEMLSYYAGRDLNSSLYANYYACQIGQLVHTHRSLQAFNSSNAEEYMKPQMIYTTSLELDSVKNALSYRYDCHR